MPHAGTLSIAHLHKQYEVEGRALPVLEDITLTIAPGEFVSIVGASGCGKSTLLRLVVGLEEDYRGKILLDGKRVSGTSLQRGIVFQEHRLFPMAVGGTEHPAGAAQHAGQRRGERPQRCRAYRAGWPARLRAGLSAPALWRHVAARGDCAGTGDAPRDPAARRALRRARRDDAGLPAAGTAAHLAGRGHHHDPGHPRCRGSRLPGRPRGGDGTPARPHPPHPAGGPAASARTRRTSLRARARCRAARIRRAGACRAADPRT
ncbi:ABC-type transporter, ATPase component [Cupriavidus necator H16]|uniref:ABC-type transporter, ATPase component n=1 Tax=Cupriavidus necator (strain ATCC 17699 / DSM 428 / KCTC 22496 / NCIMB 10442 / H16 / Stanier 337) TaxID=381666 RepID=Q0JZ16_CUPNH|nr:ABC-type transporter, ATPase component [Cupriavidus necator H16]